LWASVSPPTAFLYVGRPGWAGAGFAVLLAWVILCLTAGFSARLYSLLVMTLVFLIYSALPILFALVRRPPYSLRNCNDLRWYISSLVAWLLLLEFIHLSSDRTLGIHAYVIPTNSMENTLYAGDHILADTRAYDRTGPARGDLVVHLSPRDRRTTYVKRVAGLPGDTVELKFKLLYVNGELVNPTRSVTYRDPKRIFPAEMSPRDNFGPTVLGPGEYFVLGDNRDNSHDSRFWGSVPRELIIGQAKLVYLSREGLVIRLERIGLRLDQDER